MPDRATDPSLTRMMTAATPTARTIHDVFTPDSYHTDGTRLLRVDCVVGEGGDFLSVEDCRTLDVVVLAADELLALGLRPIRPSPPA